MSVYTKLVIAIAIISSPFASICKNKGGKGARAKKSTMKGASLNLKINNMNAGNVEQFMPKPNPLFKFLPKSKTHDSQTFRDHLRKKYDAKRDATVSAKS